MKAYIRWGWAQTLARWFFLFLFHALYRVRINGLENIPKEGGAILVFNHSSWLDGAIILTLIPRRLRPIAWAGNFVMLPLRWWAYFCGVILVSGGPHSIRRSLEEARDTLRAGGMIGIFPEGGISRSGQIRTFRPGVIKIREGTDVPVIPCFIDETWGSIFSYSGGRAFWKWPRLRRQPISLHIGEPLPEPKSAFEIRQAVMELSVRAVNQRSGRFQPLAKNAIRQCKRRRFKEKIGDLLSGSVSGGNLLTRALVLRRLLRKHVLSADEQTVGILIPPTTGSVIVNAGLALDRRAVVNLNYTLSEDLINHCIRDAGIRHVLTSEKVMEKFGFKLDANTFMLEELKDKVGFWDKAVAAFQAYLVPGFILNWMLGLNHVQPDEPMTIVYTSGSTGVPKGVVLTQRNIQSNVDAIDRCAAFRREDCMVGILPFFHSFGYTATLWGVLATRIRGAYHVSPLESRQVGKLVERFRCTILVATPTFLRSYTRRCTPEQFKSLDTVVAGAERLPPEVTDQFEQKFGVRPVEGYGTTELSPIVSLNIPQSRDFDTFQIDCKEGTVGRPIPNEAAQIRDLDTHEVLGPDQSGMLWIAGPNVMKGYLNLPEKTAEVLVDGWYQTGDVALIDNDGFIKITGRISRFSKIGGEMVPHVKIEEVLSRLVDATPDDDSDNDEPVIAVTAVPDPKKGERLVVLYTRINKSVPELIQGLKDAGLPNIFIPTEDSFRQVDHLPLLGSGKLDLKAVRQLAEKLFLSDGSGGSDVDESD